MKLKTLKRNNQNKSSKESNKMLIEMDMETAKSVREILFESQIGYTYDESITPIRILKIRNVIDDIDSKMD